MRKCEVYEVSLELRAFLHADFAEVGEDFIEDDFNLTGLSQLVPFYKEALEMVLDVEPGKLKHEYCNQRILISWIGFLQRTKLRRSQTCQ